MRKTGRSPAFLATLGLSVLSSPGCAHWRSNDPWCFAFTGLMVDSIEGGSYPSLGDDLESNGRNHAAVFVLLLPLAIPLAADLLLLPVAIVHDLTVE